MSEITLFTIGGDDVTDFVLHQTLEVEYIGNNRGVLRCLLEDHGSPAFRPSFGDEVVLEMDGVREFSGVVWTPTERDVVNDEGNLTTVEAVDASALLEFVMFNGITPAGTLRDAVAAPVLNLAPHQIILNPAMAAGPTVGAQGFRFMTIKEIADRLSLESSWVHRVIYSASQSRLLFEFVEPGTVAAPFQLTSSTLRSVEVEQGSLQGYINEAWAIFGEGARVVTQRWYGDGATREFRLNYDLAELPGVLTVGRTGGVTFEPTSIFGQGFSTPWYYDRAQNWNQRWVQDAGEAVLGSDEYVEATFLSQFPNSIFERDLAAFAETGRPYTGRLELPEVFDYDQAHAYLLAHLRRFAGSTRRLKGITQEPGLRSLQTTTANLPNRGLASVDVLITGVRMRHVSGLGDDEHLFEYEVEAVEGDEYRDSWLEYFQPDRPVRGFGGSGGGVGGENPPETTNDPEVVLSGPTSYPIGARGVTLTTSSSTAWTDTAWVEVMPAASAPATFWALCGIHVEEIANLCDGIEFDVSLGLAGSEVAGICATFRAGGNTRNSPNWLTCPIPIGPIAPGTRVSVRCRYRDAASQSAKTQYVKALYYPTVPAGISLTTRPFRSATPSSYITLTTSSSAWANPAAFTEIIAATAAPWQLSQVLISEGDIPFNSGGDEIEIDVATGPASSEVVQTTVRIHTRQGVAVSQGVELDPILAGQIPAGVRVSMRARHRRAAALTFGVSAQYYEGAL